VGLIMEKIILAQLSPRVTVEQWPGQTFWRWVVADEYTRGVRSIRAYASKASAMRAGRRLAAKGA
jgi:hypothetical protein